MDLTASSLLRPLLALFVALVSGATASATETEEPVRIKVSGPIAERFPRDVLATVWAAGKDSAPVRRIGDMPIQMPWQHFVRNDGKKTAPVGCFIDFADDKHERIAAVRLSRDLFDTPRTIDVVLKRPETFVAPASIFGIFGFRYHALISRRMQYSDIPRWDAATQKFLKPAKPVLRIYRARTGVLLQQLTMRSMCYGDGWAVHADFPAELPHGAELRVVVLHDTGDLFGQLKAECSFTYKKEPDKQLRGR